MKNLYYYSDAGCIKIGNENFNSMLLNGRGEGSFWIHLCDKNENFDKSNYEFVSRVEGDNVNVYENDIGDKTILKLEAGEYSIFHKKGEILIEKIN